MVRAASAHRRTDPCPTDIIVTAPLPPFLYEPLKADYRCHDYVQAADKPALLAPQRRAHSRTRARRRHGDADALLDALPTLEIISVFGVGYDGVPVDYCRKRGLKVTNTPDVLTDDVADVAVGLVMMTGRGFVRATLRAGGRMGEARPRADDQARRQDRRHPGARPHRQGDRRAALGDGDEDRLHRPQAAGRSVSVHRGPDALAAASDFLIVACPGGAATTNIVNADVLAALGKKGTLVNIARGSIVDEPALVAALQAGTIKGAGLDVFADEPNIPAPL